MVTEKELIDILESFKKSYESSNMKNSAFWNNANETVSKILENHINEYGY